MPLVVLKEGELKPILEVSFFIIYLSYLVDAALGIHREQRGEDIKGGYDPLRVKHDEVRVKHVEVGEPPPTGEGVHGIFHTAVPTIQ